MERVGVRGPHAQTRGEAPSPGAKERADLSPQAGRGEAARQQLNLAPIGLGHPRLDFHSTAKRRGWPEQSPAMTSQKTLRQPSGVTLIAQLRQSRHEQA